MKIGFGYDSHRLVKGRKLILGGVDIPFEKGLLGHSDGDALLHAITDAIIGALGLGDIGRHFPDTDQKYSGASSIRLLKHVVELASAEGYEVTWVDCTVVIEEPKLSPFIDVMQESVRTTGIRGVNIKAKSNEKMGPVGKGEGVVAYAVCLLSPLNR